MMPARVKPEVMKVRPGRLALRNSRMVAAGSAGARANGAEANGAESTPAATLIRAV